MNVKSILLFVGGLTIGTAAGVFGSKKYFQEKYQKQYEKDHDDLEKYYHRVDEYSRTNYDEEAENEVNPVKEGDSKPSGRMTQEERSEIKKKLNKNWEGTTNYAGMYHGSKSLETEHPLDQGEDGEEKEYLEICENCKYHDYDNDYCSLIEESVNRDDSCSDFSIFLSENSDYTPEEQAFDEHQKNKNKPPKIISAEAYSNLPAHIDQEVLYFYAYDEMLCDDNEEPIDEPERLVGDSLTKYGFVDNEERLIFVMNYSLDTCYEIQKVDSSWTDTH